MDSPGFNPFIFDLPAPTASTGGLIQSASAQEGPGDPAAQNAAIQQQYPAPPMWPSAIPAAQQYAPLPDITYLLSETVKIKTVLLELLQSMSTSQHSVIDAPRVLELLAQLGS